MITPTPRPLSQDIQSVYDAMRSRASAKDIEALQAATQAVRELCDKEIERAKRRFCDKVSASNSSR